MEHKRERDFFFFFSFRKNLVFQILENKIASLITEEIKILTSLFHNCWGILFYFLTGVKFFTMLCWFLHTEMWISHNYIYIPLPLMCSSCPPHPLPPGHSARWSQSTKLEFVLYSNFLLAIYFTHDDVYMSMLPLNFFHALIPPPCPQVCSLCLHLHFFPASRLISTIFLDVIYMH